MPLPSQPVTLSPAGIAELNQKLADMRHDINNHLSLIVAAVELMRYRPETAAERVGMLAEQPGKISDSLKKFSAEFEKAFGITRP